MAHNGGMVNSMQSEDMKGVVDPSLESMSAFTDHYGATSSDLTSPAKVLAGLRLPSHDLHG